MKGLNPSTLPTLSTLALSAVVGALVGVGVYQASVRGYLPFNKNLTNPPSIQKVETVVKEENSIINTVDAVSPSVVAIGSTQEVINPFDPLSSSSSQNNTIGTGFVVSDKGVVITNRHVVADTQMQYTVVTKDGKKVNVEKIYRDPILDLAIIQLGANDIKPLELGDSSKLKVGQTVIAIGNALGKFTNTVTSGIVSGLGRRVVAGDPFSSSAETLDDLIQTDAAINPGNSGGPLLNSTGQVIGVNVATTEGAQNIGFAIPINDVKKIVDEFVQTGKVSHPFLGIQYQFINQDVAIRDSIPKGDYVLNVVANSSASRAGISTGDIITKVDNQPIDSETKLSQVIAAHKIGDQLNITIWSDTNAEKQISITLSEYPNQ